MRKTLTHMKTIYLAIGVTLLAVATTMGACANDVGSVAAKDAGADGPSPQSEAGPDAGNPDSTHICVFDTDKFDNGCVFGP